MHIPTFAIVVVFVTVVVNGVDCIGFVVICFVGADEVCVWLLEHLSLQKSVVQQV